MLKDLPLKIVEYLVEEIPPYSGLLMIKVDNRGVVKNWKGNPKEYLGGKLTENESIEELVPALNGICPFDKGSVKLTKLQLKNKYCDIHVVKENGHYWIIFIDQTREVDSLKSLLQNMNEEQLKGRGNKTNSKEMPFRHLDKLNFATFLRKDDGSFSLQPNTPGWIKKHAFYNKASGSIDPISTFPFLEIFILEVEEFWKENKESYVVSETWSETFAGKDHYLRAYATNLNNSNYLFLKSFIREGVEEQNLLQAFRDSSLAFDKLAKTEKKLKELLVYKNKFNSIISHDLRAPIAAVLGVVNVLTTDEEEIGKLNEDYQELIYGIKDEMNRLLDYNNKLYHWANLELGNFKLEFETISLDEIIKIATETAREKCNEKNIALTINVEAGLKVRVDKTLFLQALNNLLSNAIKFTPISNSIKITAKKDDDKAFISVVDTGIGMNDDMVKNLFKESTNNTTQGTSGEKGTGLGLGIIKKIIEAHKFKITVKSVPGKGTVFTIEIPESNLA
ncbi:MAG: hypothetical protein DRJ09_00410 [Bacteroidetes bacterium]|nr:MAG: hypothetical protein DRJ09_00410 [Bacteroidota bacterium]